MKALLNRAHCYSMSSISICVLLVAMSTQAQARHSRTVHHAHAKVQASPQRERPIIENSNRAEPKFDSGFNVPSTAGTSLLGAPPFGKNSLSGKLD